MDKNEWEIIRKFKAGDETAFEELVECYQKRLYNLAWQWTNNKEDALDICQNAFIKLHRVLETWKPRSSLFTWLYRVVVNMAIDLGRKKARQFVLPLSGTEDGQDREVPDESLRNPGTELDNQQLHQDIQQAIATLPKRQQKAFVLRHLQGLAIKEIAGIMCCSEGAIKSHIYHAARKLRTRLEPRWGPSDRQPAFLTNKNKDSVKNMNQKLL